MKPKIPEKDEMEVILRARAFASCGYRFWTFMFACLVFASVVGPALSAAGFLGPDLSKIAALVGSVAASFAAILKPHEQLTKYDNAFQMLWQTRVAWILRTIGKDQVAKEVRDAIEIMKVKYYDIHDSAQSKRHEEQPNVDNEQ